MLQYLLTPSGDHHCTYSVAHASLRLRFKANFHIRSRTSGALRPLFFVHTSIFFLILRHRTGLYNPLACIRVIATSMGRLPDPETYRTFEKCSKCSKGMSRRKRVKLILHLEATLVAALPRFRVARACDMTLKRTTNENNFQCGNYFHQCVWITPFSSEIEELAMVLSILREFFPLYISQS
jgi:hypothetical protein